LISSPTEYQKAREELDYMARWLSRLESEDAAVRKDLTISSVRKMISRLQNELAEYETAGALTPPASITETKPDNGDVEQGV
jgi:hypothetical protein